MIFDETVAGYYDDWYQTKLGRFIDQVETKLAFELFMPQPEDKILDVGCGTGNFSFKLAEKGCQVTGIDISQPMLAKAQDKAAEKGWDIDFYQQEATNLEFTDQQFDGVFSMATVEFISDLDKFFAELWRVVKPGGQILIGTINSDSEWGRAYRRRAQKTDTVFKYANFKTQEEINDLDREHLVASEQCLFIPPEADEDQISWEEEKRLADRKKGGFFCSLWEKSN